MRVVPDLRERNQLVREAVAAGLRVEPDLEGGEDQEVSMGGLVRLVRLVGKVWQGGTPERRWDLRQLT